MNNDDHVLCRFWKSTLPLEGLEQSADSVDYVDTTLRGLASEKHAGFTDDGLSLEIAGESTDRGIGSGSTDRGSSSGGASDRGRGSDKPGGATDRGISSGGASDRGIGSEKDEGFKETAEVNVRQTIRKTVTIGVERETSNTGETVVIMPDLTAPKAAEKVEEGTQFGTGKEVKTAETEQLMAAEVEEKKTFAIKSVVNPADGAEISLQDAIMLGVIQPDEGIYVNSITGEKKPIAEAMSDGLIKVSICHQVNSAWHPSGVAKSSNNFDWGKSWSHCCRVGSRIVCNFPYKLLE